MSPEGTADISPNPLLIRFLACSQAEGAQWSNEESWSSTMSARFVNSLRRALELEGYDVELAADGEEALERSSENGEPDAVDPRHPHAQDGRAGGLPAAPPGGPPPPRPHADRARRGGEPGRRARRRRGRLRHEALRARGAARPPARASPADGRRLGRGAALRRPRARTRRRARFGGTASRSS